MVALEGRVVVVTGAGRGLGRDHALFFAANGAQVVVNDLGVDNEGHGADATKAEAVVDEIRSNGGSAVANHDDVATWQGAKRMVDDAIEAFGDLDVLVNNAGFLRDRAIVNMSEDDWDEVIRVHLKGHMAPTRWAAAYWREQHKAGSTRRRNLVNTSSTSGIYANPGQGNYGAAKSGVATLSQIAAAELAHYGVVSNCVIPGARTRLTMGTPGLPEIMEAPAEGFDIWDPANVSPLVAYLAGADCPFNGETFYIQGATIRRLQPWTLVGDTIEQPTRWELDELSRAMSAFDTSVDVSARSS